MFTLKRVEFVGEAVLNTKNNDCLCHESIDSPPSEYIDYPNQIVMTKTGHVFHYPCLMKYLKKYETCPFTHEKVTLMHGVYDDKGVYKPVSKEELTEIIEKRMKTLIPELDELPGEIKNVESDMKLIIGVDAVEEHEEVDDSDSDNSGEFDDEDLD